MPRGFVFAEVFAKGRASGEGRLQSTSRGPMKKALARRAAEDGRELLRGPRSGKFVCRSQRCFSPRGDFDAPALGRPGDKGLFSWYLSQR